MIVGFLPFGLSIFHIIASLKALEATSSSCVLSPYTKMKYTRLNAYLLMDFGIIYKRLFTQTL